MKEIERRFKMKYLPTVTACEKIEQGYIFKGGGSYLRVRIVNQEEGSICFKHFNSASDRDEFEYIVPLEDAKQMMLLSKSKVSKNRFQTLDKNVVIDVFENGLSVVEVENQVDIPDYCGEEVTELREYSNLFIAK